MQKQVAGYFSRRNQDVLIVNVLLMVCLVVSLGWVVFQTLVQMRLQMVAANARIFQEQAVLQDGVRTIEEALAAHAVIVDEQEKPLAFQERLLQQLATVRQNASAAKIALPPVEGLEQYRTAMPAVKEYCLITKEFVILQEVVDALVRVGVTQVIGLSFEKKKSAEQTKKASKQIEEPVSPSVKDVSLEVEINCSSSQLVRFLREIENSAALLRVDNVHIESDRQTVKASLRVSSGVPVQGGSVP